ncbi:MAG TPA: acyl carrier protein [Candidatus Limnocylindrales bacterium]|nr:acyl carrier protein [Candidatus Limnocylindrales bacterium]
MTDLDIEAAPVDPALRQQVVTSIIELLPTVLKREMDGVDEETNLMSHLGLSSTTALELVLMLEESLEREISVENMSREDFDTVGTLGTYIAGNLIDEDA